jgi:hypothetical protein
MLIIRARNVNDAFAEALWRLPMIGVEGDSRNGKVMRAPFPVITEYSNPTERMLLNPKRDANPFFHIFEAVWMLAGRNDVEWIQRFNSNIAQFSDDGQVFHGAYGYRWRHHFGGDDQLLWLIEHLSRLPNSRRGVLNMYDPQHDQETKEWVPKDIPCNTVIYFSNKIGALDMTVCCRSNDAVWGCYGANAVHFSFLQEFIANALGWPVGAYRQISNDFHVYERHFDLMGKPPNDYTGYPCQRGWIPQEWIHCNLTSPLTWEEDLRNFTNWVHDPTRSYSTPYIPQVLNPMLDIWNQYKLIGAGGVLHQLPRIADHAVREACELWLTKRVKG